MPDTPPPDNPRNFQPWNASAQAPEYFSANMQVTIPVVAGVDPEDWGQRELMQPSFFPTAHQEARRRVPCDWGTLDDASQYWLQMALIYYTAALVVEAANPGRTEDVKIGAFSFKTDNTGLLADQADLFSQAAISFANIVLPAGIVPVAVSDGFARPMIRKASVCGFRRRLF
ncbi:MAG: hypothetical protein ACRYFS_16355 [Janthinobacterium lividum]